MGAGQSSDSREAQRAETAKTSYYELLGIDKSAAEDEIKKAYRKKALELHPDRNYGDVERTTALFAEIQSAYEVLSDPQERAWYDSHEDAILNNIEVSQDDDGASYEHSVGITSADDITRMFRNFNADIEFSDAPSGFFGYLREVFEKLAKEELAAAAGDDADVPDYPDFGHKDDDHDYAKMFYSMWSGFSTQKTFAWRDRYRVSDAEDRRMRRLMEKENKRFRTEAIAEFNDAVRSLIAFVRKRDPRYKPNVQSEEERQQTLRDAAKAQAARMRAANQAKMNEDVPEWTRSRESEEEQEEDPFAEESEEEQFECVACRKVFKSENQFAAHEKSKKHVKAVQALRRKLEKDGFSFEIEEEGDQNDTHSQLKQAKESEAVAEEESQVQDGEGDLVSKMASVSIGDIPEPHSPTTSMNSNTSDILQNAGEGDGKEENHLDGDDANSRGHGPMPAPQGEPPTLEGPKMGKAAQKRAKKAAQQAAAASDENPHKCAVCKAGFPSKTRLFQHIGDLGHAAPADSTGAKGKGKGKKR